jgi:hypothetical protein
MLALNKRIPIRIYLLLPLRGELVIMCVRYEACLWLQSIGHRFDVVISVVAQKKLPAAQNLPSA